MSTLNHRYLRQEPFTLILIHVEPQISMHPGSLHEILTPTHRKVAAVTVYLILHPVVTYWYYLLLNHWKTKCLNL